LRLPKNGGEIVVRRGRKNEEEEGVENAPGSAPIQQKETDWEAKMPREGEGKIGYNLKKGVH